MHSASLSKAQGFPMLLDRLTNFFTSLKLTVVCLALAMVLLFIGTLAQVNMGLYKVQAEFFRSFVIFWGPPDAGWKVPVFPGGYLIGSVLLVNLVAANFARFRFSKDKIGTLLTHGGLVLLLLGQLATDMLLSESHMRLSEGEEKNYSESDRLTELAVVDVSDPDADEIVAIPDSLLAARRTISHAELPFTIRVERFLRNASLSTDAEPSFEKSPATRGSGRRFWLKEEPRVTKMDVRDVPASIIELHTAAGSLGTWLVSESIAQPQSVTVNGRTWQLSLRLQRYYKPFSLRLLKFSHDKYPGSDITRNFSSRVRLLWPDTGEDREVLIKMNNPLRYGGETFYQAGYDENDPRVTILQVVHNPSWLTPYVGCLLVSMGLVIQFMSHLIEFLSKRRAA
jgi:hypothetical protein